MQFRDWPLSAAWRSTASGRWLLRAPSADPFEPAAVLVGAIDVPDGTAHGIECSKDYKTMRRFNVEHRAIVDRPRASPARRAEVDSEWREQLLWLAGLVHRLAVPSMHDAGRFHEQTRAIAYELRRLARWTRPAA
jgi:hypothetical protein